MQASEFTPLASLAGGALIGLAATLLMLLKGRIMGATGIFAGAVLGGAPGDRAWRVALLAGMISGPLLYLIFWGHMPQIDVPVSRPMLVIGGVLVGLGVSFGSGCTSGHGVCGLARFSKRSLVATLTFMLTGFVSVFVIRHLIGI